MKKLNFKHAVEFTFNKTPNQTNCEYCVYEYNNEIFLITRQKLDPELFQRLNTGQEKLMVEMSTINMVDNEKMKKMEIILKGFFLNKTVEAQDIMYGIADNKAVDLKECNGKHFTSALNMTDSLVSYNSDLYIRIHRSHFINFLQIGKHSPTPGYFVIMKDGKKLNVGREYKEAFLQSKRKLKF